MYSFEFTRTYEFDLKVKFSGEKKMALLLLPKGRFVRMGQKQMCHLCDGNRNSIFFVRWEKN
jgi:hypothetical protein